MFLDLTTLNNSVVDKLLKRNIQDFIKTLDIPLKFNLNREKWTKLNTYINDALKCLCIDKWSLESSNHLTHGAVNMLFILEKYGQFKDNDMISDVIYDFIINQLDETHFLKYSGLIPY